MPLMTIRSAKLTSFATRAFIAPTISSALVPVKTSFTTRPLSLMWTWTFTKHSLPENRMDTSQYRIVQRHQRASSGRSWTCCKISLSLSHLACPSEKQKLLPWWCLPGEGRDAMASLEFSRGLVVSKRTMEVAGGESGFLHGIESSIVGIVRDEATQPRGSRPYRRTMKDRGVFHIRCKAQLPIGCHGKAIVVV